MFNIHVIIYFGNIMQACFFKNELSNVRTLLLDLLIKNVYVDKYIAYPKNNNIKTLPLPKEYNASELTEEHIYMVDELADSIRNNEFHKLLILSCTHAKYQEITQFLCENTQSLNIDIYTKEPYYNQYALRVALKYNNILAAISILSVETSCYKGILSVLEDQNLYNQVESLYQDGLQAIYDTIIDFFKNESKQEKDVIIKITQDNPLIIQNKYNELQKTLMINGFDGYSNNLLELETWHIFLQKNYIESLDFAKVFNEVYMKIAFTCTCFENLYQLSKRQSFVNLDNILTSQMIESIKKYKTSIIVVNNRIQKLLNIYLNFMQNTLRSLASYQKLKEEYEEKDLILNIKHDTTQKDSSQSLQNTKEIQPSITTHIEKPVKISQNITAKNSQQKPTDETSNIKKLQKSIEILTDLLNKKGKADPMAFRTALKLAREGNCYIQETTQNHQSFKIKINQKTLTSYHQPHNGKGMDQNVLEEVKAVISDQLEINSQLQQSANNKNTVFFNQTNNGYNNIEKSESGTINANINNGSYKK